MENDLSSLKKENDILKVKEEQGNRFCFFFKKNNNLDF